MSLADVYRAATQAAAGGSQQGLAGIYTDANRVYLRCKKQVAMKYQGGQDGP